jgi:tRNA nucleotidyltransferase (CCA-adding enzyme)
MTDAAERLESASVPSAVLAVLTRLNVRGFEAFLVGGCVRDALLCKTPKDFDIATNARPEQITSAFERVIPTGIEHGTVTVVLRGARVEVTTYRTEGKYEDGRRPTSVSFEATLEQDLARRDFTINAMAYSPITKELQDPFGGIADLEAQLIRCVGNPHERFAEDGLRPMRAVRFMATLGFNIENETLAALAPSVPVFRKVAIERINTEFSKMLVTRFTSGALVYLNESRLLHEFLPEAADALDAFSRVGAAKTSLAIRLAVLLRHLGAETVQSVLERIKYPTKLIGEVVVLVKHCALPAQMSDTELRRLASVVGTENVNPLMDFVEAITDGTSMGVISGYRDRLAVLLAVSPPLCVRELALNGKDIMARLNAKPGPIVGKATRFLFEQVLENPELNTAEQLAVLLQRWADSSQ